MYSFYSFPLDMFMCPSAIWTEMPHRRPCSFQLCSIYDFLFIAELFVIDRFSCRNETFLINVDMSGEHSFE